MVDKYRSGKKEIATVAKPNRIEMVLFFFVIGSCVLFFVDELNKNKFNK